MKESHSARGVRRVLEGEAVVRLAPEFTDFAQQQHPDRGLGGTGPLGQGTSGKGAFAGVLAEAAHGEELGQVVQQFAWRLTLQGAGQQQVKGAGAFFLQGKAGQGG